MRLDSFDEVKKITKELVSIPSMNKEPGQETNAAKYVRDYYMNLKYFKDHPDYVKMFQTKNDFLERHSVISFVKGTKGKSNKTVILIGHIDTVGVDDFGTIKEYAFKPDELPKKMRETFKLSEEVLKDMDSGEYMFGRGALDMKSGVAGHMYIMKYFSEHTDELDGNIVHIAECDEEDNSKGIITGLDELVELKERENLEYIACINADYSTDYSPGDENRYIYFGTVGKLLPCYCIFGKEAHVGAPFSAFDPNLLLAEITRHISHNADLCDIAQGEVAVPPISLKQMDTKPSYTVQTALTAFGYYNYFTHGKSPADVLEMSKMVAEEAYDDIIEYLNKQYKKYCDLSHVKYYELPWKRRVRTWDEFHKELASIHGKKYEDAIEDFKKKLHKEHPEMDLRMFGLKVCEEAWKWSDDKTPICIVFFGSIFSARIEVTGKNDKEKALLNAVEGAIDKIRPEAEREIKTRMFYPYIADSSFMEVCDDTLAIQALRDNMPQYGVKYVHEIDKIEKINVPVVNIGTFGRDGHMLTERVDMKQTFRNVPNITFESICTLLS